MKNLESIIKNTETSEFLVKKPLEIYESYEVFCQENNLTPVTPRELKKAILSLHDLEVRPSKVNGKTTKVYKPVYEVVESLEGELWTDVKGYKGEYKVSTHGRLKRILLGGERLQNGRINNSGYLIYSLSKDGEVFCTTAQQVVAQAFIPNPLNLSEVDHINTIKNDNNVHNLRWVSSVENKQHSRDMEKFHSGEIDSISVWSGEDILEPTITLKITEG